MEGMSSVCIKVIKKLGQMCYQAKESGVERNKAFGKAHGKFWVRARGGEESFQSRRELNGGTVDHRQSKTKGSVIVFLAKTGKGEKGGAKGRGIIEREHQ